ncbi:Protein M03B6.2 [Aphelenchoides avenae]|nr:Protein M03B6.2 [Aphelenchus avenae]
MANDENGRNHANGHTTAPSSSPKHEDPELVEDRLEELGIAKPPDGGYGWVVVFASFMANMIVDGVIFSISESIVPLWEEEFKTTTSMATIAPSLLAGCYLLSGPLASALANNFGCNKVAMAGAIVAASGFLLSVMVPALPVLYFTFGIIGGKACASNRVLVMLKVAGVGYGLVFLPAIVIVGQYFSERRALATGIATCGSGIGTTLLSYINPYVLSMVNKSWRLFLVFVAGVTILCTIFGYFFKPLKPDDKQVDEATKLAEGYLEKHADEKDVQPELTNSPHVAQGVAIERIRTNRARSNLNPGTASRPFLSTMELHASRHGEKKLLSQADLASTVTKASIAELNKPLARMDAFYLGSTTNLEKHRSRSVREPVTSTADVRSTLYLSTAGLPSLDSGDSEPSWKRSVLAPLRTMLDTALLKSPSFLILAVSGFLTLSCFFVPFMFIGALARQSGVDESQTKYLVMILGMVNLLARVFCGLISDHPKVDPLVLSNWAVIAGGLATMLAPFLTSFWMYALYCVPFALGVGCFAALRSVICVELLGLEKLTNAYGILLLFMGVAALAGPPFAAFLKNLTHSFDVSFYVMGALMTLSGAISLPLRAINKWELAKDGKLDEAEMKPLRQESA